jgi:hypothetical protein
MPNLYNRSWSRKVNQSSSIEIEIFNAQAHTLHQSKTGAIQQGRHYQVCAVLVCQYAPDLIVCENNRYAVRPFDAFDVIDEAN